MKKKKRKKSTVAFVKCKTAVIWNNTAILMTYQKWRNGVFCVLANISIQ